ncbi:MAG: RNA polymerase sigma factor [Verrucomicrobiota bacterium]
MHAPAFEPVRADPHSLTPLVRENRLWVEAMARRHLGDPALAEEVTQDVFLRLSRLPRRPWDQAALRSWLLRTVWFLSANARRKAAKRRSMEAVAASEFGGAAEIAVAGELPLEELAAALDALPELEKVLVLEHYFEGRAHGEIGDRHHLSGEAARKRIARSLVQLRSHLTRRGVALPAVTLTSGLGLGLGLLAETSPAAPVMASVFWPPVLQSPLKIAALTAAVCAAVAVPVMISQQCRISQLQQEKALAEDQRHSSETSEMPPLNFTFEAGGWTPQNFSTDDFPNVPPMAQWLIDSLPALTAAARGDSSEPLNLHVSITMSESITRLIRKQDEEMSLRRTQTVRAEVSSHPPEKPRPARPAVSPAPAR